jgi:Flp pilus assembly protein TadD
VVASLLLAGCAANGDGLGSGNSAPSSLRLADSAAAQGDHETAAALYRREFAANPDSIDALVGLGQSYRNLGQTRRGEQALREALSRRGDDPEIMLELARTQLADGRADEALETLQRAQAEAPRDLRIITARGIALDQLGRHAEAQVAYRRGLKIDPTDFALLSNLALSLGLSGTPGAGIEILKELVRDSQATARTRGNLALLYGLAGREREARAALSVDLDGAQIEENIAYYRKLREMLHAGRAIGNATGGGA